MYRPTLRRQALRLGLLATLVATLVVLALSACGGDEKKAKARPLPEEPKALRPGTYRSEEFKPSLSFQVGKGWLSTPLEASDLLGGAKGQQFDVVVEALPEDYSGVCGQDCVDITKVADGRWLAHPKGDRTRLIVLEDVEGETVTVALYSRTTEFGEFTPKAQKVVDSVKWTGS
jgi:hypothetical protein